VQLSLALEPKTQLRKEIGSFGCIDTALAIAFSPGRGTKANKKRDLNLDFWKPTPKIEIAKA